jgi:hypothetical protein
MWDHASAARWCGRALGARRGTTQRIVGLFDQQAKRWRTVTMNDGTWLGLDPNFYDVSCDLMMQLAAPLGPLLERTAA